MRKGQAKRKWLVWQSEELGMESLPWRISRREKVKLTAPLSDMKRRGGGRGGWEKKGKICHCSRSRTIILLFLKRKSTHADSPVSCALYLCTCDIYLPQKWYKESRRRGGGREKRGENACLDLAAQVLNEYERRGRARRLDLRLTPATRVVNACKTGK